MTQNQKVGSDQFTRRSSAKSGRADRIAGATPNSLITSILLLLILTFTLPSRAADQIELNNGETHQGQLNGMTAGFVLLTQTSGAGSIERRFSPDKIKKLHFSDTSIKQDASHLFLEEKFEKAAALYEGLVWQRLPYLGILNPEDEQLIADLIHCYIMTGRSPEASERIRLWKPKIQDPAITSQLEESAILAAWKSKNTSTALLLAHNWIDQNNSASHTCLAWSIIAQDHWTHNRFKAAHWTSLQPIVFSNFNTPRHLNTCYAIAILSAIRLDDPQHAKTLKAEMLQRSLPWPIELPSPSELDPLSTNETHTTTPPAKTIDQLRKLLGTP